MDSQITFLNFYDFFTAKKWINDTFSFPVVNDQDFACIWRVAEYAFLGAVDASRGTIKDPVTEGNKGTMVTFVTENVEKWHQQLLEQGCDGITEIRIMDQIQIKTFFISGPEGYTFEIQEFLSPDSKKIFHQQKE